LLTAGYAGPRPSRALAEPTANFIHRLLEPLRAAEFAIEDNPAGAAADVHGTIGEIGPFAFLDCGIKGVAIDMGDR